MARTTITDTIYCPDGSLYTGTIFISWPTFYTGDLSPKLVRAGNMTVPVQSGALSVQLEQTVTSNPSGAIYTISYAPLGTPTEEFWQVPASGPVTIASCRVLSPSGDILHPFGSVDWVAGVSGKPFYDTREFTFVLTSGTDVTCDLSATGAKTATIAGICPIGLNGNDTNHSIYISGGTGTAEAVLITGGTARSGVSGGTLTFTTLNTHTGAWTLGSASTGIQEAVVAALAAGIRKVQLPPIDMHVYAEVYIEPGTGLEIEGSYPGTQITLHPADANLFNVVNGSWFQLGGLLVQHALPTGATAGAFVKVAGTSFAKLHDIFAYYGWDIIDLSNVYLCQMNFIYSQSRLHYGIKVTGTAHHTAIQAQGIQFGGSGTASGLIGLYVAGQMQSSEFSQFVDVLSDYSVYVNIPASGYFNETHFSDCTFDSFVLGGVHLTGSVGGTSGGVISFANCRVSAGSGSTSGFAINSKYYDVTLANNSILAGGYGVILQGAKHITVANNHISGVAATGVATGIYLANDGAAVCDQNKINDNLIGQDASWPVVTGIGVSAHAHTNVTFSHNSVTGTSADLSYGGTGTGVTFHDNKLVTGKPTADASIRGSTWYTVGGGGVADTYEVASKDAGGAYAWRTLI